ncbi:MAG: response regulator [bacterium]|nr:MAG: response regulator [bacterium]
MNKKSSDISRPRVLVVDDDRFFLRQMADILAGGDFEVVQATDGGQAMEKLLDGGFQLIVTDVVMKDISGIDLLRRVRQKDRLVPVICVSGVRSFDNVVEMIRNGASDFLSKPFKPEQLLAAARKAYSEYEVAMEKEQIVARSDKWSRELLTLRQLGEASSKEMLQTLFRRTIEAVSDTLQVETASLMLMEEDRLRLVEALGLPREVIGKATVELGQGISGHVAQTGKPLLINDINKHEKFRPSKFRSQYSTQSALCVPLVRGDRVLGVLNANNKVNGEAFTESDRDLLVTMAAQVAMSIDNARLFAGLEEKAEALKLAHEELVRLDKDKTELILNISHELKTPLTTIIGFASLIPSLDLTGETESLTQFVERLSTSASHLNYLVERILELFRLEAGRVPCKLAFHRMDRVLDAALKVMSKLLEGRRVGLDLARIEGVRVKCDTRLFSRVLEVVLENAVKFSPGAEPIDISASWHESLPEVPAYAGGKRSMAPFSDTDGYVEIIVRDRGKGMREKEIPLIFEKFKQLGDILTEKPTGIGLGLSIARAIMERHHGAIWAQVAEGGGTELHLLLTAAEEKGDEGTDG